MKVLILAAAIFATGCSGKITDKNIVIAEKFCEDKGGISYMYPSDFTECTKVACKDGTYSQIYKGK